jgi:hypothetical protein
MDIPVPSQLNSAVNTFAKGGITGAATSLQGGQLSSLSTDNMDMFAGVMDGRISAADVEQICSVFAVLVLNIFLPGNPLATYAGPLVGQAVGSQVAQIIPTDVSLFPSPMNASAVPGQQYANVQSGLSNNMTGLQSSMNLPEIPDNINDVMGSLNNDRQTDNSSVDTQIKFMMDMVDNPMAVFSQISPIVATLLGSIVPGILSKSNASTASAAATNATKMQLLDEISKGKQTNLTMASSISVLNSSNASSLPSAMNKAIPAFKGYCDDKINALPDGHPSISYYTDMKNKVANADMEKIASDTGKDMDKNQISSLLGMKSNYNNSFYTIRNAWAERQQNNTLDTERSSLETSLASKYGSTVDPVMGMKRTLTTNMKFMAKVVKMFNKSKSTNDSVLNVHSQALTGNISRHIPDMKPEDVAVFSKSITRQMPSQQTVMQSSGMDNLQYTGEKIISQLNILKTSLAANGLVKETAMIVPMTGIATAAQ